MGLYFNFYVEICRAGKWEAPEAPDSQERESSYPREFTWLPPDSCAYDLFFRADALFPFRPGLPPDIDHSRLLHDFIRRYGPEEERMIWWIPYPELMVDLWDEPAFFLQEKVPATKAHLFGDGRSSYPAKGLEQSGLNPYQVDSLRDGSIVPEPIDRSFGKGLREIKTVRAEAHIPVTWRDSVRGYIGDDRADAFKSLRSSASDSDLRVIAWLC